MTIASIIIVFLGGLAWWMTSRIRQRRVQPGTFVFVKGEEAHRWYVEQIDGNRAHLLYNAGAYGGRWVETKRLTKPPL